MFDVNFLEILRASFSLVILLACSVAVVAFTAERWFFFRKISAGTEAFIGAALDLLEQEKFEEALSLCRKTPGPLAAIIETAVDNRDRPKEHFEKLISAKRLELRLFLEKNLGILGTLGNTAPFIGLFGTVIGIIKAFQDLAHSGSAGPSVVAAGIAEALVATAGGLAVAIPAVISYNYFLRKVKNTVVAMETAQTRLTVSLKIL
ncbi:MAG: MotA/TolQ/ExbB proton channel family protein [Elusimicrobia bacterium]|nr:MotA/TolQ/ExbB proton channel family protein [Elusimicrobiota bacterium]